MRGDENVENSNFIQLSKLRSKDFVKLNQWLEKETDKNTLHDIQNELLMLMANQILSGMADQIRGSYFSIIYDEYTDISNKEQLTFCLGWVDESFNDHEEFLGFYEVPNIKSDTIVSAVRVILLRTQISLESCRSQCYDGASNMLRKRSGVVKQIIETQPKFFTHCHCYMLSLSVKEMTKESKILSNAMDTSAEITILIKYSPKREQMLEQIKELSLSIEDESERNQAN